MVSNDIEGSFRESHKSWYRYTEWNDLKDAILNHIKDKILTLRSLLEDNFQVCKDDEIMIFGSEPIVSTALTLKAWESILRKLLPEVRSFIKKVTKLFEIDMHHASAGHRQGDSQNLIVREKSPSNVIGISSKLL